MVVFSVLGLTLPTLTLVLVFVVMMGVLLVVVSNARAVKMRAAHDVLVDVGAERLLRPPSMVKT
jgi:hypothetical protein